MLLKTHQAALYSLRGSIASPRKDSTVRVYTGQGVHACGATNDIHAKLYLSRIFL